MCVVTAARSRSSLEEVVAYRPYQFCRLSERVPYLSAALVPSRQGQCRGLIFGLARYFSL